MLIGVCWTPFRPNSSTTSMGSWGGRGHAETDGWRSQQGATRVHLSKFRARWALIAGGEAESNDLVVSVDEDGDHLRVDAVRRQERPQHPEDTHAQEDTFPN